MFTLAALVAEHVALGPHDAACHPAGDAAVGGDLADDVDEARGVKPPGDGVAATRDFRLESHAGNRQHTERHAVGSIIAIIGSLADTGDQDEKGSNQTGRTQGPSPSGECRRSGFDSVHSRGGLWQENILERLEPGKSKVWLDAPVLTDYRTATFQSDAVGLPRRHLAGSDAMA